MGDGASSGTAIGVLYMKPMSLTRFRSRLGPEEFAKYFNEDSETIGNINILDCDYLNSALLGWRAINETGSA